MLLQCVLREPRPEKRELRWPFRLLVDPCAYICPFPYGCGIVVHIASTCACRALGSDLLLFTNGREGVKGYLLGNPASGVRCSRKPRDKVASATPSTMTFRRDAFMAVRSTYERAA